MALTAGAKLGRYEILGAAGAGGMGEVYRARDTRLDRFVAIKVLPSHLSTHPDLRQRLEREARAISQLSHPHICALFDVGNQDGVDFLVLEYLEGETLADRLRRGPLSTEQFLRYAVEIADALESAHRSGIVHRDLKPGNVMLTNSGAKLMDFGLARASVDPRESQAVAEMVTMVSAGERPLTAEGFVVGTFQYMAPEQLEGAQADRRSDIFALGSVLYEMATGKPSFEGKTRASLIAAILSSEPPPIARMQPVTPPELDRIVRSCLAKEPDRRWQSAHDIKLELEWVRDSRASGPIAAIQRPARWAWALGTLLIAAMVFFLGTKMQRVAVSPNPVYRTALQPPMGHSYLAYYFAVSPDGTRFAFTAAAKNGVPTLWMRTLAADSSQEFSGTEGASGPFWSPDSKSIAFFAQSKLKKLDVETGAVQSICDAVYGRGGTWNRDGEIVFGPRPNLTLLRVKASGGEPVPAIKQSEGFEAHRWPLFLPDGRHFLYYVEAPAGHNGLYIGSLDDSKGTLLSANIRGNVQFSAGHLLFVRDGTLFAQPFDTEKLRFAGDAVPIVNQDMEQDEGFGVSGFSVSNAGALVYQSRRAYSSRLVWFALSGKELEVVGPPASYEPRLSFDGRRVAVTWDATANGHPRVHVIDPLRGTVTSITPESDRNQAPVWSPDSSRIVYAASTNDGTSIKVSAADGTGEAETLDFGMSRTVPNDWSHDGRYVVYMKFLKGTPNLWAYDFAEKKASALPTPIPAAEASISPDGRWIAYSSTHHGGVDIFVQPFPGSGRRIQISNSGGTQSRWRGDGKELFYIGPRNELMAVSVQPGKTLEFGPPRALFTTRIHGARYVLFQYAVSSDGQRFLINSLPREDAAAPMTLLTDWTSLLKH